MVGILTRSTLILVGVFLLCPNQGRAQDTSDYNITYNRGGAITDWSTAAGTQIRIWAHTIGNYVATARVDDTTAKWVIVAAGVDGGIGGVSFTDGATPRQRTYFPQGGDLRWYNLDNDVPTASGLMPATPNFDKFNGADVAAVTWDAGGTQRIAVAAISDKGRVCVWEQTYGGSPAFIECTASEYATVSSEIVGTVADGTPWFVFRGGTGTVRRFRRASALNYVQDDLGVPGGASTIGSNFWALPTPGLTTHIDFGCRRNDGLLAVGRVTPTGTAVTWTTLSAAPGGAAISSTSATLAATRVSDATNQVRIFARCSQTSGIDGVCTFNSTTGTVYSTGSWMNNSDPPAGQEVFAVLTAGLDPTGPRVFASVGTSAIFVAMTDLMDTAGGATSAAGWRDHVKPITNGPDVALGELSDQAFTWANEGAVALTRLSGVIVGIERNVAPPWRVNIAASPFAGQFWDEPLIPITRWSAAPSDSQTDPMAVGDPEVGVFHTITLEVAVEGEGDTCSADPQARRLVYRRAATASQIASMGSSTMGTVGASDPLCRLITDSTFFAYLDHEGLTLSGSPSARTAHSVYQYAGFAVAARTVAFDGALGSETFQSEMVLGPPVALTDAGGEVFYWSWKYPTDGVPRICEADASGPSQCGDLIPGAATPMGDDDYYRFGPSPAVSRPCNGNSLDQRCVDLGQGYDIVADRNTPRRFYATWQGADANGNMAIWFQMNVGNLLSNWTTPVRVSPEEKSNWFADPNIVALDDDTLVISYIKLAKPGGPETAVAQRVSVSTDYGAAWQSTLVDPSGAKPSDLAFHCGRQRYFLGEYHDPAVIGNRSEHIQHTASAGRSVFRTFFASRSHWY